MKPPRSGRTWSVASRRTASCSGTTREGEYAADLDGLDLPGVRRDPRRQRRVRRQEPAAARRATTASSSSTARVTSADAASATGCSTWSWPTGCSPRTGRSLVQQELGLTADGIDEVVAGSTRSSSARPSAVAEPQGTARRRR